MKILKLLILVFVIVYITGCSKYEPKIYDVSKIYNEKYLNENIILKINTTSNVSDNPSLIVTKNKDLVYIDTENIINIIETKNSNKTRKILGFDNTRNNEKVNTIALNYSENILAVAGIQKDFNNKKGSVRLFDYKTGKLLKNIDISEHEITDIEFIDNGEFLIVGNDHGQIISYNLSKNKIEKKIETHTKYSIKDLIIRKNPKKEYVIYASSTLGDSYLFINKLQYNADEFFIEWVLNSNKYSYYKYNGNLHTYVDKNNKYRVGTASYITHSFINSYLTVHDTKLSKDSKKRKRLKIFRHENSKRNYENVFFSDDGKYLIVKERLLYLYSDCKACHKYTNKWKIVLYDVKNDFKKINESRVYKRNEIQILGFFDNNNIINRNNGILEKIDFKNNFKTESFSIFSENEKNNLLIGIDNGVIGISETTPLKIGKRKELNKNAIADDFTMRDDVAYINNNVKFIRKFDTKKFIQSTNVNENNFKINSSIKNQYRLLVTSYGRPLFEDFELFSKKDCSRCSAEVKGKFWANWGDYGKNLNLNDHLKRPYRVNFYGWYKDYIVRATKNLIFISNLNNEIIAVLTGHRSQISSFTIENNILYSIDKNNIIKYWDIGSINEKTRDKLIQPYLNTYLIGSEYIVWTPDGFFDASKGAAKYIGYHVNQGRFKEAEFVTVENMYSSFYRPDLVQKALKGESLEKYAKQINIDKLINAGFAPSVKILTKNQTVENGDLNVKVQVCPKNGGYDNLAFMINEVPISVTGTSRALKIKKKAKREDCFIIDETLALASGKNEIGFKATNKVGNIESKIDTITVNYDDSQIKKTKMALQKITGKQNVNDLHILAVGVNDYDNKDWKLSLAVNDGRGMLKTIKAVAEPLFNKIHTYELFDKKASKENIIKTFKNIKSTRDDVFLLFVAGHGLTDEFNGDYYFIPVDMMDVNKLKEQGLGQKDLMLGLSKVTALKSLVLLDTCHSGALVEADMQKTTTNKLSRATGRAILSASSSVQLAKEGYKGHGLFTYTLMEALKGKGYYGDEKITVNELADYTEDTLPKRALDVFNHRQTPQRSMYGTDFNIGEFEW